MQYTFLTVGAPTATPIGANPDGYEPNNSAADVLANNKSFANVGTTLQGLNFYTNAVPPGGVPLTFQYGDVDWYAFYGRAGSRYQVTTDVQPGVDTEMFIYVDCPSPNAGCAANLSPPALNDFTNVGLLASSDDYQPLNRGSRVIFSAPYDGRYWIKLWNKDPTPRTAGQTYTLNILEQLTTTPTITGTLGPPPTPFPAGLDRFEYNGDFDSAALIAPGVKYDQLNFVPFQPSASNVVDNDFFRLPVKQGVYYTCDTIELGGGTDTNMIVYNQDRQGIDGNDDISQADKALGKFGSRVTWLSGYNGFAYILIGDVNPPRANEGQTRTYSLLCTIGIPATPTPTVNPNPPTPTVFFTPAPPEPTATPFPTPRPAQPLVVQPVDAASLQPTVQATPTPRVMMIDVQAFLDYSRNGLLDPGEGISGAPVRVFDELSGTPLGQAFTDGDGRVRFSIMNEGPVRVSLPSFGYSTVVDSSPATVRVGILPSLELPERIP